MTNAIKLYPPSLQGPEDYARALARFTPGPAPVERVAEYLTRLGAGSGLYEALPSYEQLGHVFGG